MKTATSLRRECEKMYVYSRIYLIITFVFVFFEARAIVWESFFYCIFVHTYINRIRDLEKTRCRMRRRIRTRGLLDCVGTQTIK